MNICVLKLLLLALLCFYEQLESIIHLVVLVKKKEKRKDGKADNYATLKRKKGKKRENFFNYVKRGILYQLSSRKKEREFFFLCFLFPPKQHSSIHQIGMRGVESEEEEEEEERRRGGRKKKKY